MINSDVTLTSLNQMSQGTLLEHLGIEFTDVTSETISAKMPVDHRTRQPMGLLHGGASVALAESIGKRGFILECRYGKQACVGLDINATILKVCGRDGYTARSGITLRKANPRMGDSCYQ